MLSGSSLGALRELVAVAGIMFKHEKFRFHPQKDLVLSMPYQFVANLEPGQFIPLDKLWLKNVKKI